jgi:hypothetical protein
MRFPLLLLSLAPAGLALVLTACGDPPAVEADGGAGDGAARGPSELFGPCVEDSQCPGEGAVCRRDVDGYPRGYCTIPCVDRTPCDLDGVYNHCVSRDAEVTETYCDLRCLTGLDCGREGYTCAGELPPSGGVCIGVCSEDAHCADGHVCEPYSGTCYPMGMAPTTGAITGEPCGSGADCRSGTCQPPEVDGNPTGWAEGMCTSNCILPPGYNSNTFFDGTRLPQGGCAGDAVCFPDASYTEGDLGICFDRCATPEDCRLGYECTAGFPTASGATATFDDGVCLPADCSRADCPAGYECTPVMYTDGSVRNICDPG